MPLVPNAVALVVLCVVCIDICSATYAMNTTCSPPAAQGGKGYCGPSFCDSVVNTANTCVFTSQSYNYATMVSQLKSKTCTQSSDARCASSALKALMKGQGIKAAYCNDAFLVIVTDSTTGFSNYLSSIRNPPAAVASDGTACVTRTTNAGYSTIKIPLYPTLQTTSDPSVNNVNTNSYPNGGGDGDGAYMSTATRNTGATYGLPTRGAIGVTIGGQDIFPVFNNVAYLAPQKCEVDTCNEHVGGGGGQPHLHGDPFGSWCLYSAANYSSATVHPPQIGWAYDGPSIYGRHLSTSNLGYSTPLDSCGGHAHGTYAYHYHTQVLTATTDGGAYPGKATGVTYYASTTGPYKCLKGDISLIPNFYGNLLASHTSVLPDTTTYMCAGTTKYYTATGITLPNTVSSPSSSSTSSPTLQASKGPTKLPSSPPTRSPPNTENPSSAKPTRGPTFEPSFRPTAIPSYRPTSQPSYPPTVRPTKLPTSRPSKKPTGSPSLKPSGAPTRPPTSTPSKTPTFKPTMVPTKPPTLSPSKVPTFPPTQKPSTPTVSPSKKKQIPTS